MQDINETIRYTLSAMRCRNKAFTMVELLVVSALVAVIALGTYSIFSSGVKIWLGVNRLTPYEDLDVFFDKLASDIRNAFNYHDIGFIGEIDKFEFATLVTSSRLGVRTVGKVIYSYDSMNEKLIREERDYSHEFDDEEGIVTESLSDVDSLRFSFYAYDDTMDKYIWKDDWTIEEKSLPLAVRVTLGINDDRESIELTRTISIPTGG